MKDVFIHSLICYSNCLWVKDGEIFRVNMNEIKVLEKFI